ncbi:inositol-3-phosphate synthase [Asanoa sp. NPDC049518]|uniref:inositol-3-phosphate synthase n=1 Tax=unclassified Asanoa TaxID=2685164 RepID=UPI0034378801
MIRTALVGVGSCASSLVQAVHLSREHSDASGVAHPLFGGYRIGEIEIVAAFDVDRRKVGKDLAHAIFAEPNCATRFSDVPFAGVTVAPGPLADGVSPGLGALVQPGPADEATPADVAAELKRSAAEVLVVYLPVGATQASRLYAVAALESGCALINCTPAPLATDPHWAHEFADRGLPLLGDDIKSQFGSTALHRALVSLITRRGGSIDSSYQLNAGGNADFANMLQPDIASHKRHTKHAALDEFGLGADALSVGPSGYIAHLGDRKVGYINIVGRGLMGAPFSIEVKLEVEDSPNSAGVVVDAVRAARVALDRGVAGPIDEASAALFKNPSSHLPDDAAFAALDRWAASNGIAP